MYIYIYIDMYLAFSPSLSISFLFKSLLFFKKPMLPSAPYFKSVSYVLITNGRSLIKKASFVEGSCLLE